MPLSASTIDIHAPAVALSHVSHLFGSFAALRDVNLRFAAGSSVLVLGPNGAGKSTLLKLIAGLVRPSYGEVRIFDRPPAALRGRIAYLGHQPSLYDELTGPENLLYFLHLERPNLPTAQADPLVTAALQQVDLDPGNPRRVGEYSQGMRQRASLARVLLHDPLLLLLDEPFSNLDAASSQAMVARLLGFLAEPDAGGPSRTLLLTTHQAQVAAPLARQTLVLENGHPTTASIGAATVPVQELTQ